MKIFISHAVIDKEIAEEAREVLILGGHVAPNDIFLSSYAGTIPNGQFFVNEILTKLNASNLVIALISKPYLNSTFCLEEVGAAQAKNISIPDSLFTLLIPPATFHDLNAVLYGTQSGEILDAKTIDELLDRVTKGLTNPPNSPARNKERDKFLAQVTPHVKQHHASQLLANIKVLDLYFERNMSAHISYKLKLRVTFRNETGHVLRVKKALWKADANDVKIRPDPNSSVQLEGGGGWLNDSWGGEQAEVVVNPNQAFRVWIGLNWDVTDAEFRQRHESGAGVGCLQVPIAISGYDMVLEREI
jgi:TIR domain